MLATVAVGPRLALRFVFRGTVPPILIGELSRDRFFAAGDDFKSGALGKEVMFAALPFDFCLSADSCVESVPTLDRRLVFFVMAGEGVEAAIAGAGAAGTGLFIPNALARCLMLRRRGPRTGLLLDRFHVVSPPPPSGVKWDMMVNGAVG